nr:plant cysteine oxidase 2-like isoform X1 [Ipomoea batatas]
MANMVQRLYETCKDVFRNGESGYVPPPADIQRLTAVLDLIAPCDVSVLFPAAGGNMHCFRALTPCAILDVLGPPYSQAQARHCTYYHDFPFTPFSSDDGGELNADVDVKGYAWLEERAKPESFIVAPAPYSGPTILER